MRSIRRWGLGGGLAALLLLGLTVAARGQAAAGDAPVNLKVIVPTATAKLEIEGQPTRKTGTEREFVSPALPAGKKYVYTLKVTWTDEKGKETSETRMVAVQAGQNLVVDFSPAKKPGVTASSTSPGTKPTATPSKKVDKPKLDVPYVPTPDEVVKKMLDMAGVKEGDVIYDLGCGDGRIVVTAVSKYKAKRGKGIDIDPARIADSKKTAKDAGVEDKVEFIKGSVFDLKPADFEGVTVVTLYLLPEINLKLKPLLKGLKPGTRIVSHDFDMGDDWKADKTATIEAEGDEHMVFLWTIKEKKP